MREMASRVELALLAVATALPAAGCFNITLGKDDGIQPVTYDETFTDLPDLASAPDGTVAVPTKSGEIMRATISTQADGARGVLFARQIVVFDDAQAAHDLDRFGPDQIGAIRGVKLLRVESRYDGLDLLRAPPPSLTVGSRTLGPGDDSVELDDDTVDTIRSDLLTPKAVALPFALQVTVPAGASDALASELHVTIVLQPELTVDATRAL